MKKIKKDSKTKFLLAIPIDFTLLYSFTCAIVVFNDLSKSRDWTKVISLVILIITFATASFCYLKFFKHQLEELPYSYKNIYLFKKFTFLFDSLIIVSLSFLLGISSSLLTVLKIEDELIHFELNAFLIGASCIAVSTKATIEYTYTIWDTKHKKNGDEPTDEEI